ncbi:MAG: tetratricopeptide repeat protein [Bacteroidales bacterium]|jgi:tetratricopeptide (TPR) repeat protein|nr:tetratricopeptide repeat protein [Bacteroidales bacterium]
MKIKLRMKIVLILGVFVVGYLCCWGAWKRDYGEAIAELTNAIQAQPQDWSLYLARGKEYANKGVFNKAIADYTKAIKLNPGDDSSFEYRGRAYYETGKLKKAIADYITALQINPDNKAADMFIKGLRREELKAHGVFIERMPESRTQILRRDNVNAEDSVVITEN